MLILGDFDNFAIGNLKLYIGQIGKLHYPLLIENGKLIRPLILE